MKTNQNNTMQCQLTRNWSGSRMIAYSICSLLSLVVLGFSSLVYGKGKPVRETHIQVSFDATSTGLTTDGGATVIDGVDGTYAIVGSAFDIIADLQSSSRGIELDLSSAVLDSTGVDIDGVANVECDRIDLGDSASTAMLSGDWSFSNAKFRVLGRDIQKLAIGASAPTNADLEFHDAAGNRWQLRWGPYEHAGSGQTYNPGADPVSVTRVDENTWDFSTTGQHHAALYRYGAPSQSSSQVYYGQFAIPFSGTAEALSNQSAPSPSVSEINVILAAPEIAILEPAGDQSLPVGSSVDFTAVASDHCLDISGQTTWTCNGKSLLAGASWTTTFTEVGLFTVTATAINRSGATSTDSVQITVGIPSAATMSVDSISHRLRKGGKELRVSVTIVDALANPVSGANVAIQINGTTSNLSTSPVTTNSSGTATFILGNVASDTYTATVDSVTHNDFDWDGAAEDYVFSK